MSETKKKRKTVFKFYSAWNYEREIEELNEASAKGWQLTREGMFSNSFERDESVRYKYQLDFHPRVKSMGRYLQTHSEQGWELVSKTLNGWYCFRKIFDPTLPDEEYEIYTDSQSVDEMNKRWRVIALVLLIGLCLPLLAICVFFCITKPSLRQLVGVVTYGVAAAIMGYGYYVMRKPKRSKNDRHDSLRMAIFLIVLVVGTVSVEVLHFMRPYMSAQMDAYDVNSITADISKSLEYGTIEISYPDYYYLDLEAEADKPLTFSLIDEAGDVKFQKRGDELNISDERLRLSRGKYTICLSDFAGGKVHLKYRID